jgi:hypothetical protein
MRVQVTQQEGESSGRTQESDQGHPVQSGVSAERGTFEQVFLDTLNGRVR